MFQQSQQMQTVEWAISDRAIDYDFACAFMEKRCSEIRARENLPIVWLLEHPAIYTAGTSAQEKDLIDPNRFPVYTTGRGGQYTYHGPGQRVAYVMLDLKSYGSDVRYYVSLLEKWIIMTLRKFNIIAKTRQNIIGVWAQKEKTDHTASCLSKISSIGVRITKWVSFHGISINIDPDLDHFNGIIPCGLHGEEVTSIWDLGLTTTMSDFDIELRKTFETVFSTKTQLTSI